MQSFRWISILLGACALACAQTPGLDAFRELRRRLDEKRETASLVASLPGFTPVASLPSLAPPRPAETAPPYGLRRIDAVNPERESTAVDVVRTAACRNGVPPDLALAVVDHESRFRNDVTGALGEIGASQILPATANGYGFDLARLRMDFSYNVEAGVKILRDLSERFGGDWTSVLRAYNGGPNFSNASAEAQLQTSRFAGEIETWRRQYGPYCP